MRLGLGTVQFGTDYGISNTAGRVAEDEVDRILRLAAENEIAVLDTAAAYGESEAVLGRVLWAGHPFHVVTKIPPLPADRISRQHALKAKDGFLRSLERLRQPSVYGLLAHHAPDLWRPGGGHLVEMLLELKQRGLARKIGASFYSAAEIREARACMAIELAQVPVNVVDQRLIADGQLGELHQAGTEIHARSIFLQGLLLMDPSALPAQLARFRKHLELVGRLAAAAGISRLSLALGFVGGLADIDVSLVGVTSAGELREILAASHAQLPPMDLSALGSQDEALVNPSRWPALGAPSNA
jgi:aryl-alcohol dehydrogenase-like predicted oxidoreductase